MAGDMDEGKSKKQREKIKDNRHGFGRWEGDNKESPA